jgi:hypothetical protein
MDAASIAAPLVKDEFFTGYDRDYLAVLPCPATGDVYLVYRGQLRDHSDLRFTLIVSRAHSIDGYQETLKAFLLPPFESDDVETPLHEAITWIRAEITAKTDALDEQAREAELEAAIENGTLDPVEV